MFTMIGAVCFLLAAMPNSASADLLVNGGFEDTDMDGDFGDGWGSFGAAGFNAFFGENGHASFFLDNADNSGGVFQTGIAGTAGTEYTFSLDDVLIEANAAADSFQFGFEYFEADDATAVTDGSGATLTSLVPITLTAGSGLSFSHTAIAPAGTAFVRPIISFSGADGSAEGSENVFVFGSTLTATAIPEPSSVALVLVGGVMGVMRRRRRPVTSAFFVS
jgi:hypothetical protein